MICGMHIHAGIEDEELRIDLMNQATYFLPHLLALSTSSPFWEGQDTGLKAYRPTIFRRSAAHAACRRTSRAASEWQRELLRLLRRPASCDDATKIWWDMRPAPASRRWSCAICDVCTRLEDALTIAALYAGDPAHPLPPARAATRPGAAIAGS